MIDLWFVGICFQHGTVFLNDEVSENIPKHSGHIRAVEKGTMTDYNIAHLEKG